MNEEAVKKYRTHFREKYIPQGYSGRGHLATTLSVTSIMIILSLYNLENVASLEWLTIPLTFFLSNFVEYKIHKGPMHKKTRFLEEIFQRHAVQHHAFFTHEHMEFDEERDYFAVLFPPVMLLFFFGAIATPIGIGSFFLFGGNVAWLFVLTVSFYFMNYEIMHFLYHVSEEAWTSKLPFMGFLRRHHTLHHDRELMNTYNFNITYPLCDFLFGAYYRGKPSGQK